MALDENQRATLAAHIKANADLDVAAALAQRNDTELTRLYNLDSGFTVWREAVQPEEYREALVWTEIDALPAGKARIWEWITQGMTVSFDATKDNVRKGLADAFDGNMTTRGQMLAVAKELATVNQSIFATGTGTNADPGVRVATGPLTILDVGRALNENEAA